MTIYSNKPSLEAANTLAALRKAVANVLDRKRRLGQYAVVWRDGKPALLDEEVDDRAAFYAAMRAEPGAMQEVEYGDKLQADIEDDISE